MKTFPLQSLTIIEAQQKQFALVDSICRHFPGSEFLTGGCFSADRSLKSTVISVSPICSIITRVVG